MKITLEDYFGRMSRAGETPSEEVVSNATVLIAAVNGLLDEVDVEAARERVVNSGWRSAGYNATISNAAPRSRHITGNAIDVADPDGELDEYLFGEDGRRLLERWGLYMEHPMATKGWCHLQNIPPRSGRRVFMP